ncbi:hypothetical protein B0J18DRAFT_361311 [Chaetomium sp. MPI-SDFR-AT-0129]|nr:hypothetical protein B0J18DRAFT_361311 [Chaetomium sp. MPI-SDFR-AT-0129]
MASTASSDTAYSTTEEAAEAEKLGHSRNSSTASSDTAYSTADEIQAVKPAHTRNVSTVSSATAFSTSDVYVQAHQEKAGSGKPNGWVKGHAHTASTATDNSVFSIIHGNHTKRESYSSVLSDLEAQDPEYDDFKRKRFGHARYMIMTVYRRLFSLAFIGNAIAFIYLMYKGVAPLDLVNASAINITICGLCRQPLVINMLYMIFGGLPRSTPMWLKRLACKIGHLGGVHSGTGVAACVWYIGFAGTYTYHFVPSPISIAVLTLVWFVLALLLAIIAVAHPTFRRKYHDYFELTHRFSNWAILVLFWVLIFLLGAQEPNLSSFLINLPAFWIIIILTAATIHPWLLLRKVPVKAERLSPHAIRLHFSHTQVKFGHGMSLSRHPLKDWHGFASFPDTFDAPDTKFSVLVSKAGDWTRDVINNPPTYLWKRGVPTFGFGYVVRMFDRIIVVTTGSGIGPCLSFLEDAKRPAMRVVWQTKSPIKTYGEKTLDLVRRMDENPLVIDTSVTGRVDMLPAVLRMYKDFDAQAVIVISNPPMTKKLVYGLECRGIAAYGPLFDS